MKPALVIVLATIVLAACSTPEKPEPVYHKVHEPEPGLVCDRIEKVCFTGDGPSVAGTEKHFGPEAARTLQREVDLKGAATMQSIEFSDGVICSYRSQLCVKRRFSGDVAPHHTKALFGEY